MANILKLSALIQNTWDRNTVRGPVRHKIPEINAVLEGKNSVVLEITGTSSHTLVNDATNFNYDAGTILTYPGTNTSVEIVDNIIYGFAVVVTRAAAATAPTGYVSVANSGFGGWVTSTAARLHEDAFWIFHSPSAVATTDSTGLTINMSTGTGYKVSLICWCKS